ncbi:MAG: hypothetical protein HN936_05775 [Bacteroidetes bacterium]|nr:hypothetical protein [Bacteroidota bacterium]MBT7092733.1 hypothetical protein [Bacteroidota bacterium]MBT7466458.1 hypothetical protein [Bacteroidota bacterium]
MIEVLSYDLPDSCLIQVDADANGWHFWQPDEKYLVLGQSNKAERSLIVDQVLADNVRVYKRPSGGESVILSPKTLVISVRLLSGKLENPQIYFRRINSVIINALKETGVKDISYKGISDITIGEKKILGSSIYRKKNMVFYHAVLNVSENILLISKYLQHPPKEPDYRQGRDHADFVTSLHEAGYQISVSELIVKLNQQFSKDLSQ